MAATQRFSLCIMEAVLLLLFFQLINMSICAQIVNYPYEDRRAALEKIERPVIKQPEQPALTSVKNWVVRPAEYEQIKYDAVVSSDMLCCVSANTAQNEEILETHPVVQYSAEELLYIQKKHQFLNILANVFNRVLSNSILKIVHSILNTFNNRRHHSHPHLSHHSLGQNAHEVHASQIHSNALQAGDLLQALTGKSHQEQQHQQLQQQLNQQEQHLVRAEHPSDKLVPQQIIQTESKNYNCMHL